MQAQNVESDLFSVQKEKIVLVKKIKIWDAAVCELQSGKHSFKIALKEIAHQQNEKNRKGIGA